MSEIGFDIYLEGGSFRHDGMSEKGADKLDRLLDRRDSEDMVHDDFVSALRSIVKLYPGYIDGHAHLGYALLEAGDASAGLKSCLRGIELGENAIPSGFKGHIENYSFGNRPFLRALHGAILCLLDLGERKQAVSMMKKMLKWAPNDSYGVRLMIGTEYMSLGMDEKALPFLRKNAEHYPPHQYDLGLYYWRAGDLVKSITALRHGFIKNPFIVGMLLLEPMIESREKVVMSSHASEEEAAKYVERAADAWRKNTEAIDFLNRIYRDPMVVAERMLAFTCLDRLVDKKRQDWRHAYMEQHQILVDRIDDYLSRKIVAARVDPVTGGFAPVPRPVLN